MGELNTTEIIMKKDCECLVHISDHATLWENTFFTLHIQYELLKPSMLGGTYWQAE